MFTPILENSNTSGYKVLKQILLYVPDFNSTHIVTRLSCDGLIINQLNFTEGLTAYSKSLLI
jgi:hypothetical protein